MNIHWPRRPLGLGPPLNLVTLSPIHRASWGRRALNCVFFAIATAVVIAAIDQAFFDGETARRTPALDAHPTPAARVAITFVGGLLEEMVFRVLCATAVATVVWSSLRRVIGETASHVATAQWVGTLFAAVLVGAWHVWMAGDPSASVARVLTVNTVSNMLYGWTYWRNGLEMSTLSHGTLNTTLYLGLPILH